MYYSEFELRKSEFSQLKKLLRKEFNDIQVKRQLQNRAQILCKEATQELENTMYNTLINEELEIEELIEYVIKIIDESDASIDLDHPHKTLEDTGKCEYITGIYPYVVEDEEGEQYIGGRIYVCIEVEIVEDEDVVQVTDINVYCE